jgi:hypothetical protein
MDYFANAGFGLRASEMYIRSHEMLILELVNCEGTLISCVCKHKIVECVLQLRPIFLVFCTFHTCCVILKIDEAIV